MVNVIDLIEFLKEKNISVTYTGKNINCSKLAAVSTNVENSICYYDGNNPEILSGISKSIVFCKPDLKIDLDKNTYIFTKNPQLCFYTISTMFAENSIRAIDPRTKIDSSANIGLNASIGPFCSIEACEIGNNVTIETGVKIHKGTVIGNNVHIQSNTVIGVIGVMWIDDDNGNRVRFNSTGNTIIEDDVFISSCISISRGAFLNKPTIIGRSTMIAHGTSIGHGCDIGAYNHFANNVTLAGSVLSGIHCFFGSGCCVRPHIKIPDRTVVGTGAVVVINFSQSNLVLAGNPAKKLHSGKEKLSGVPRRS